MAEYRYIDNDAALAELCQRWLQCPVLAIDTEFIRERTFYPITALIQVADGEETYLLDPVTITDFQPLAELFKAPEVLKVLHSCSEDLEVFRRFLGCVPEPVFDTQIAAVLAGMGPPMGYQKLVQQCLGVTLDKGETRSDWLQRPLTISQCHYAALDVAYLIPLYRQLRDKLQALGRLPWCEAECRQLLTQTSTEDEPADYYRKIKAAGRLNRRQLAVLKHLAAWREREARARDVPRGRIVKDAQLLDCARSCPTDMAQLGDLGLHPRALDREGETILALIAEALAQPEEQWPELLPPPLDREQRGALKTLKQRVEAIASELALPPEFLVRKRDYEALFAAAAAGDPALPPSLTGWRRALVEDALLPVPGHD